MPQRIEIHQTGGPEVLTLTDTDLPSPASGQVLLRHTAIGVNFVDTYHRTGLYPVPLPSGIGGEAAGVVESVGPDVTNLKPGDRVVYYTLGELGAYATHRIVPAATIIPLPDGVTDDMAAGAFLKGLTSWYLLCRTHPLRAGETILIHAAGGGVGSIAVQWAKALGATVIGTVGTAEKAARVARLGCDHPIVYTKEDFVARVSEITGGKGVPVVYDSVGKATFEASLDCLAPLGLMVTFGNASGPVPPFAPSILAEKGGLFLTRPTLAPYIATREQYETAAAALFDHLLQGTIRIDIAARFPLSDAGAAHRFIESRKAEGSVILEP